jgi:hypothetical protein
VETTNRFATRTLPDGYQPSGKMDLGKDFRLMLVMNLLGLVLLAVFGWFFIRVAALLRSDSPPNYSFSAGSLADMGGQLAILIGVVVAVIVLHEAAHGLFFWIFTRRRPVFAFKGYYASASAPGWYFTRSPYLLIGLAPLVLLSLIGVALLAFVPPGWIIPLLIFLTFNAGGAVGDIMVVVWLLFKPASALVLDLPEAIEVYTRE